ncbi:MAG: protein-L-isoaspartate(D-aspartate) O-methyltransferase [Chloroflexi bacterium]|nr:protein-L-isoaspartate(D-aspartate) O-methyltransferase [Chloroflexota bacterium]
MVHRQVRSRGIRDPEVLRAMGSIPRERFVPPELADRAYDDGALGIGSGQTISQPYIVARMTEALGLAEWAAAHPVETARVLDVGTGSGYQAAVLAALGAEVVGVERDEELATDALRRLGALGMAVDIHVGDGTLGWPERAPFAGIIVAAAAPEVPEPLLAQLADGARIVVPVGTRQHQELMMVRRAGSRLEEQHLEPCVFVPLIGRFGFPEG